MIGRADIEGSKSNVAMNAWLPQASSVLPAGCRKDNLLNHFSTPCESVGDCTFSGRRSPYLRHVDRRTHTLPSAEPLSYCTMAKEAKSAADCLYFLNFYPSVPNGFHTAELLLMSGIKNLSRVPRIQVCR